MYLKLDAQWEIKFIDLHENPLAASVVGTGRAKTLLDVKMNCPCEDL